MSRNKMTLHMQILMGFSNTRCVIEDTSCPNRSRILLVYFVEAHERNPVSVKTQTCLRWQKKITSVMRDWSCKCAVLDLSGHFFLANKRYDPRLLVLHLKVKRSNLLTQWQRRFAGPAKTTFWPLLNTSNNRFIGCTSELWSENF